MIKFTIFSTISYFMIFSCVFQSVYCYVSLSHCCCFGSGSDGGHFSLCVCVCALLMLLFYSIVHFNGHEMVIVIDNRVWQIIIASKRLYIEIKTCSSCNWSFSAWNHFMCYCFFTCMLCMCMWRLIYAIDVSKKIPLNSECTL